MMLDRCLIVFIKYPQPGQVKSRLAKDYDSDFAALLYKAFVLDILECAMKGNWQLQVFFYPEEEVFLRRQSVINSDELLETFQS